MTTKAPVRVTALAEARGGHRHLSESETYTVNSGDNLWSIAKEKLGSGERWKKIYRLNQDAIGQYYTPLYPGQILHIPDADTHGNRRLLRFFETLNSFVHALFGKRM